SNELEEAGFLLQIDKRERLVVVILPDIAAFDELDPRLLGSDPAGIHVLQIVERPWGAIVATVVHAAVIDAANDHFMFASIMWKADTNLVLLPELGLGQIAEANLFGVKNAVGTPQG